LQNISRLLAQVAANKQILEKTQQKCLYATSAVTQSCARNLNETRLELSAAAELVNETASRSISSLSFQLD